jgi:hypothetical protein
MGEWKSISTDRVMLASGPAEEVATVRLIFDLFVAERKPERSIARILNERGTRSATGGPWRSNAILCMLENEKYIGNCIWNRSSCKLQFARLRNDPAHWIRAEGVFPSNRRP